MGLKSKIKALQAVRTCWTTENPNVTVGDCRRIGCPYAGTECMEEAFMDALCLVEKLYRERKELKKRVERSKEQT